MTSTSPVIRAADQAGDRRTAGFVSRLAAFTIDLIIITVIVTITIALGQFLGRALEVGRLTLLVLGVITLVGNFAIYVAYFVGFLAMAGQTPGKRFMGLRVVTADGERPDVRRSARRLIGYWLSLPLFWGYLMVLVNDRRLAFHDKFAGTRVVYDLESGFRSPYRRRSTERP